MRLNADFSKHVVIRPDDYNWVDSPANGVRRMMLDRIGDEVARATTIVEFAPGSHFDAHTHDGGEEYFVLSGVFSDESGDYPAGTYARNPIGTSHKPHTDQGCQILVKLHQFADDDTAHFSVDTTTGEFGAGRAPGVTALPLHDVPGEKVAIFKLEPGTKVPHHDHPGGEEIFVLDGVFSDENGDYPAGTWIRNPDGSSHAPWSDGGCTFWIKSGHLPG